MKIPLSKSLTGKEYHQMINEYFENIYGLVNVSSTTSCQCYQPSPLETVGAKPGDKFVYTTTSVSGTLKEKGEELSFSHVLSYSEITKILEARFSNYTVDSFSFQTDTRLSLFSKSAFKEKFVGIHVQLYKIKENNLIRK